MSEIRELERDKIKAFMEGAVASLRQVEDGRKCDKDAIAAIEALRKIGIGRRFDAIWSIDGPLIHYNHALGGRVRASHHSVAELDLSWVADIAQPPGERIFYDREDYLGRSGIEILRRDG